MISSTSAATEAKSVRPDELRRVGDIYREFLRDVLNTTKGVLRPLAAGDEDACGADFAFVLEVKKDNYTTAVQITSELEAKYYTQYGASFIVIPEVM